MNKTEYILRGCPKIIIDTSEIKCKKPNSCSKLNTYNWLDNVPQSNVISEIVEVRFKNTRKGFYQNPNRILLHEGDFVAVEATPGHDIGIVSLSGELVYEQMKKNNVEPNITELKKIYRKAKPADIEKWEEAISLEKETMLKARQIAKKLNLEMKIGDVEYQGDKTKAIFYYIADDRVDFRELIKILADEFKVRIEMRQIGARQEAGKIGGIGSCGRELCCASYMTNFVSVTTNSARYQEVSLNPQKLAGQCSKLKCCLNYEVSSYIDARKNFPDTSVPLETKEGLYYYQKSDIYRKIIWYSSEEESSANLIPITIDKVAEIIELNKKGVKISKLKDILNPVDTEILMQDDVLEKTNYHNHNNKKKHQKMKHKPKNG